MMNPILTITLIVLVADEIVGYDGPVNYSLVRNKRQSFSPCPRSAASSSRQVHTTLSYYNPQVGRDVGINNLGATWNHRDIDRLIRGGFNVSLPTILFTHGFTQSVSSTWLQDTRQRANDLSRSRQSPDFNLLFFDWSTHSRSSYSNAASQVPNLGRVLGKFFAGLHDYKGYNPSDVHLVSYSLSTHIAGLAGRELQQMGLSLGQITAVDPTGVCFHDGSSFARRNALSPTDAHLVVARHYDVGILGSQGPTGGVDIYVNGGTNQPMSTRFRRDASDDLEDGPQMIVGGVMDHSSAARHESRPESESCYDVAYSCFSYSSFLNGACADCGSDNSKCYYVNNLGALELKQRGIQTRAGSYPPKTTMYLKTGFDQSCLHHYQVVADLQQNSPATAQSSLWSGKVTFDLGSGQTVNPGYRAGGNRFTALITQQKPMVLPNSVRVSAPDNFSKSLKSLQVNYMSHPIASERSKRSARYCTGPTSSVLVKC